MLELLRIRNLALIEDAEVEFAPGLNALTGETGAGKSFVLRAIDFLTGERMGRDMVRPGRDKAVVEALFVLDGADLVLRRELAADTGRSRLFLNDALSSQEAVRELRPRLLLHTSQHGQQRLLSGAYQAAILDAHLPDPGLRPARDAALARLHDVLARLDAVRARTAELERQREFLEFQRDEIARVNPHAGEEAELEAAKARLRGLERARQGLDAAQEIISGERGLREGLAEFAARLADLAPSMPELDAHLDALEEFRNRVEDVDRLLRRGPDLEDAPELTLDQVESRLFELSRLKRKLGRTLDEILGLQAEIEANLSFLDSCGLDLKRLDKERAEARAGLAAAVAALDAARRQTSEGLCARIADQLKDLGFSEHVRVFYEFEPRELAEGVAELTARLMWAPNPGQPPQPLDRIASGGELSRFLLALACLEGGEGPGTLIFDEVDAGVGGLTLNHVADKLSELAGARQVLLVTHWPQLAARAGRHFLIRKDVVDGRTYTGCFRLTGGEVAAELARMAGGGEQGQAMAERLLGR
ncbi:MAG: DNA repair protein RecN [Desulfovibrionaceae bacterium]